jgi:hypothetical protein
MFYFVVIGLAFVIGVLFVLIRIAKKNAERKARIDAMVERHSRLMRLVNNIMFDNQFKCPDAMSKVLLHRAIKSAEKLKSEGVEKRRRNTPAYELQEQLDTLRENNSSIEALNIIRAVEGLPDRKPAQQSVHRMLSLIKKEALCSDVIIPEVQEANKILNLASLALVADELTERANEAFERGEMGSARSFFESGIKKLQNAPSMMPMLQDRYKKLQNGLDEVNNILAEETKHAFKVHDEEHGLNRMFGNEKPGWE